MCTTHTLHESLGTRLGKGLMMTEALVNFQQSGLSGQQAFLVRMSMLILTKNA